MHADCDPTRGSFLNFTQGNFPLFELGLQVIGLIYLVQDRYLLLIEVEQSLPEVASSGLRLVLWLTREEGLKRNTDLTSITSA